MREHCGMHFDALVHWISGKDCQIVDEILANAWVIIYTGWAKYIDDEKFININDDGQSHTPGTTVEAAKF